MTLVFAPHIPELWHRDICEAPHVRRWLDNATRAFDLGRVTIRDAVRFGERIGFVFLEAEAALDGQSIPRFAFLRGDSVAILVVLHQKDGPSQVLLTCEPRLPVAKAAHLSLPAGMIDDGTVQSAALRELSEETGIELTPSADDLRYLTEITLSPGGCDERLTLYALDLSLPPEESARLENRHTGLAAEHEHITLRLLPLDAIPALSEPDAKLLLAYHLYKASQTG